MRSRHPQRLAMVEFISRSAPPSSDSAAFVPKSDRPAWVDELDAASRAVVWPFDMDDGNAVPVSDGTRLRLMSSAELQSQPAIAQPSLYQLAPPPTLQHDEVRARASEKVLSGAILDRPSDLGQSGDSFAQPSVRILLMPLQMFFFDTNGYLLLKHVMDAEWLAEARAAIAAHETEVVTTDAFTDPTQSDALRGEAGVKQRVYNGGPTVALPEPHCLPFRRMLTHPGVLGRIQWMLGAGFVATNTGGMLASAVGSQGQFMHSGNTNPTDEGHTCESFSRLLDSVLQLPFACGSSFTARCVPVACAVLLCCAAVVLVLVLVLVTRPYAERTRSPDRLRERGVGTHALACRSGRLHRVCREPQSELPTTTRCPQSAGVGHGGAGSNGSRRRTHLPGRECNARRVAMEARGRTPTCGAVRVSNARHCWRRQAI